MKDRGYEHRIVEHKDTKISHSTKKSNIKIEKRNEEINTRTRKSARLSTKKNTDYKILNEGRKIIINPGTSEVAKHMQQEYHEKEDIEYNIIGNECNWYRRGIREAIEIRKRAPTLNADQGRYYLSQIWTKTLQRQMTKPLKRTIITDSQTSNNHLPTTTSDRGRNASNL